MTARYSRRIVLGAGGVSLGNFISSAPAAYGGIPNPLDNSINAFDFMSTEQIADVQTMTASIDVSDALISALNSADGRIVSFPAGTYRITKPLSNTTAKEIRISGLSPAFYSHHLIVDPYASNYSDDLGSLFGSRVAVIKCDNTSLLGSPDGTNHYNATPKLKFLQNLIVYGTNGAQIGLHIDPLDCVVRNSTFALFQWFGILSRAGVLWHLENVGFIDNGWNLPPTGEIAQPSTYGSGCAWLINANRAPQAYYGVNSTDRPTTLKVDNVWVSVRNHFALNKSGLAGIQAHGITSASFRRLGGYSGNFFDVCYNIYFDGCHIENYSASGVVVGDGSPYCAYFNNCGVTWGENYAANLAKSSKGRPLLFTGTGNQTTPSNTAYVSSPYGLRHRLYLPITAGSGEEIIYKFAGALQSTEGFTGFVCVTITRTAGPQDYAASIFPLHQHIAGSNGSISAVGIPILAATGTDERGFSIDLAVEAFGNDIDVKVTWGPNWRPSKWSLSIGLVGGGALNS
jgi:hypothetical protein